MLAAAQAVQRPAGARLMAADATGHLSEVPRAHLLDLLRPGDLVVANDAATLPASLQGVHLPTGEPVEVRLAGRGSLAWDDVREFSAIVFGEGDFHTRTEDRPAPPPLSRGDRLQLGPLGASIERLLGHPRLALVRFQGTPDEIWAGLSRHGRAIQYAHVPNPLALWDVWTRFAGPPVAFEPPSAGFALDWRMLAEMDRRRIGFATITHAAGISSTGDAQLDRRLPFDEPYRIPESTARAIEKSRQHGSRVIAIGTTVVRALEHAGRRGSIQCGEGLATQRIGPETHLKVVDAILSGTHEPESSHYELLRAFATDETLARMTAALEARGFRTHEFGDSVLIERNRAAPLAVQTLYSKKLTPA